MRGGRATQEDSAPGGPSWRAAERALCGRRHRCQRRGWDAQLAGTELEHRLMRDAALDADSLGTGRGVHRRILGDILYEGCPPTCRAAAPRSPTGTTTGAALTRSPELSVAGAKSANVWPTSPRLPPASRVVEYRNRL
jgi:hypothetical protein